MKTDVNPFMFTRSYIDVYVFANVHVKLNMKYVCIFLFYFLFLEAVNFVDLCGKMGKMYLEAMLTRSLMKSRSCRWDKLKPVCASSHSRIWSRSRPISTMSAPYRVSREAANWLRLRAVFWARYEFIVISRFSSWARSLNSGSISLQQNE